MNNKYINAISKINADEKFKNELVNKLNEQMSKDNVQERIFMKVKKVIATIIAIIGVLIGSGAVYALAGGTIADVPVLDWLGVKFSNEYLNYVETTNGQTISDNGVTIKLESSVCDDGYTVLQFRVNLSDEISEKYRVETTDDDKVSLCYLSFNDEVKNENGINTLLYNGANNYIIINDDLNYLKGSKQVIEPVILNKEYIVNQMWFINDQKYGDEENFKITLENISIALGEDIIPINGKFEIEVSKTKALENSTHFNGINNTLYYKDLSVTVENVTISPLQNIIRLYTQIDNVSSENLKDPYYTKDFTYEVYDQDGNKIISDLVYGSNMLWLEEQIGFEDFDEDLEDLGDFEDKTISQTEYLTTQKGDNISKLYVKVFAQNHHTNLSYNIGTFEIDLQNKEVNEIQINANDITPTYTNLEMTVNIEQTNEQDGFYSEGISYEQIIIDNKDEILKILDIINNAKEYSSQSFIPDFGDAPTYVEIQLSYDECYTIVLVDNFDDNGNIVNLAMKYKTVDFENNPTDSENKTIYQLDTNLEQYVIDLAHQSIQE